MTYKVLTQDTMKVIFRSRIRSAKDSTAKNLRVDNPDWEVKPEVLFLWYTYDPDNPDDKGMPTIEPESLIGRTFLMKPEEDGQRFRAKVVEAIAEDENQLANHPERIRFRCSVNNEQFEDIVSYNDILNHIEPEDTELGTWFSNP